MPRLVGRLAAIALVLIVTPRVAVSHRNDKVQANNLLVHVDDEALGSKNETEDNAEANKGFGVEAFSSLLVADELNELLDEISKLLSSSRVPISKFDTLLKLMGLQKCQWKREMKVQRVQLKQMKDPNTLPSQLKMMKMFATPREKHREVLFKKIRSLKGLMMELWKAIEGDKLRETYQEKEFKPSQNQKMKEKKRLELVAGMAKWLGELNTKTRQLNGLDRELKKQLKEMAALG